MIDLHSHVLPGLDDGAADLAASLDLARAAVADGITVLAATPHVRDDYPTRPSTMERLLGEVQVAVAGAGLPLQVVGGGELSLDMAAMLAFEDIRRFGLGGNPRYVLVETPYVGWPLAVAQRLHDLQANGITPVLAHPERNAEVQAQPELLRRLVDAGALVQVTAASLDGRLGRRAREVALLLVRRGLVHLIASDAHQAGVRGIGMSGARAAVGEPALGWWLTEAVPGAIVRGEPLPERPRTGPTRLLAWLLRR